MKLVLSILVVLLFPLSYWICMFIYPNPCGEDVNKWWDLRLNLYALTIFLAFIVSLIDSKKWEIKHVKFVLGVGIGLSVSDVLDRLLFDITQFTATDIILIILTILISYVETYTKLTQALQNLCHRPK